MSGEPKPLPTARRRLVGPDVDPESPADKQSVVRRFLARVLAKISPAASKTIDEGLCAAPHLVAKPRLDAERTQAETELFRAQQQQVQDELARQRHRDQTADALLAAEVETACANARRARAEAMVAECEAWEKVAETANKLRAAGYGVVIDPDNGRISIQPNSLPAMDVTALQHTSEVEDVVAVVIAYEQDAAPSDPPLGE